MERGRHGGLGPAGRAKDEVRGSAAVYIAAMEMTDDVKEFINIARYAHDDDGAGQGLRQEKNERKDTTAQQQKRGHRFDCAHNYFVICHIL